LADGDGAAGLSGQLASLDDNFFITKLGSIMFYFAFGSS
jgi:hypothetical protein